MVVLDFSWENFTWWDIEKILDKVWISTSKSTIPNDPNPPFNPSGLRIWLQAMTTRGINEEDTKLIAKLIHESIESRWDDNKLLVLRAQVVNFCSRFPIPSV